MIRSGVDCVEERVPRDLAEVSRFVCVRCAAECVIHMRFRDAMSTLFWVECPAHGEHRLGTISDFEIRRTNILQRDPLFEEIEAIADDDAVNFATECERRGGELLETHERIHAFLVRRARPELSDPAPAPAVEGEQNR